MEKIKYKRTKYACYFTYLAMSSVFCLPPLLFATFRETYGISYTLLGTLVLINFCTQLGVDLIFTFFGKYFPLHRTIRLLPLLTSVGLCIYAAVPMMAPQYAYVGLAVGTFVFSVASGLAEVLISPTIAAIPSDTPDKDMSALHSLYGYGFVGVTLISTIFLQFVGAQYWSYLTFFWALLPIIASVWLTISPLPPMDIGQEATDKSHSRHRNIGLFLCVVCIFLGACAENTMSNWISTFAEKALHIPKLWGDVCGMCLFAALLALTRTAYAKWGKNIFRVLCVSMAGSVVCYLVVALVQNDLIALISCVALGVCTSMLWPGTLILMEEKVPMVGVTAYALMAAGGDLGASIAPQALGIVVDKVAQSSWVAENGFVFDLTPEQVGFKVGMLLISLFPLMGLLLLAYMKRHFSRNK